MKKTTLLKAISLMMVPLMLCSCSRYYMVHTEVPSTPELKNKILDSLNRQNKYFLVHADSIVYGVNDMTVDSATLTIKGVATSVPKDHSLYLHPHRHFIWGPQRVYYKSESGIVNEVHLYTNDPVKNSSFNISVKNIQKIEMIAYDKKKTNTINEIGVTVAVAMAVLTVVAFIDLSKF
jgi:hypothetical protein